jgi:hypothetical protein
MTRRNIATTYVCITKEGMKVPISENGFIDIIIFPFLNCLTNILFSNKMHYISERAIVEETCIKSVNFIEPENSELMDQLFL